MSLPSSFLDSALSSRVEYEASLKFPETERSALETRARAASSAAMASAKVGAYNSPSAPLVKTGDSFPMMPWVQHGWKNSTQMKALFEGMSKVVIMMLPGAFTPT